MTKLGLKNDDETQGSVEASASSSPTRSPDVLDIVPESIEGPKKSKGSSTDAPENSKNGGDETILQQKERIAGRSRASHTKKMVPADDYKLPSGVDETIMQEKERIAGRSRAVHAKKAVPADDYKLPSVGDDTDRPREEGGAH